jgi:hypothetical protein
VNVFLRCLLSCVSLFGGRVDVRVGLMLLDSSILICGDGGPQNDTHITIEDIVGVGVYRAHFIVVKVTTAV